MQFYTKVKLFIKQRLEIRKVIVELFIDKTLFLLASVSKAVSATAIALMVDQES
ncbi:MAG: hypothetical protein QFX12_03435 [Rickettsia africae]|uniref:hypothetical protein n=1 Tax=Rickettsia africae TaxID=35788 RepID=UPI001391377D|nr:hypothetical protein [Rickettsia africae]